MAFSRRPCPFPKRKSACRTFARFSARPLLHGVKRAPRQWQSSTVELVSLALSASSTFLQQLRRASRIVIHRPAVGQRAVDALKVIPAPYESANNVSLWNIVAALTHSSGDSPQRQSRGTELKIHDVDAVAGALPRLKPVHIGEPAERCLEGEVRSIGYKTIGSVRRRRSS